jgi:hypothetical protein
MPSVSGIPAQPTEFAVTCPRCKALRLFVAVDGQTLYRCGGCEWYFTFGTQAPTGTSNGAITAGVTVAVPVASGGASFTNGMFLWLDAGLLTEVVQVVGSSSGTSIPVPGGFQKTHLTAMAFGQLLAAPTYTVAGRVPNAGGYGF